MDALFNRTGSADFPRHIKALVLGSPKSGKTSLLATAPNVVIADCEPEANGLMSVAHLNIPYVTISNSEKLHQLLFVLRDDTMRAKAAEQMGMEKIETVAIDTLDALQKILKKDRLRTEKRTQFQREDWGWLLDQMREIVNTFNSLPLNVIYTVHTTTKQDDDEKMVTMPALQGAFAEEIAGMVGYSLLMQRTREVRPDGTPYTAYSLKVEGDDKNPHLGNRASGRLPEVITPDFKALQTAVFEGLNIAQAAAGVPAEAVLGQTVVNNTVNVAPSPGQDAQPAAAPAPAQQAAQQAAPPTDDSTPVNATALQHLQRLFAEVGAPFDEDLIKAKSLGEARQVVMMWNAFKQDAAEGKGTPGRTPQEEMQEYLRTAGFVAAQADQTPAQTPEPAEKVVAPKIDGTIEQVLAYVGNDLARVQEAYDMEATREKPRATLVNALVNLGAKTVGTVQTGVGNDPAPASSEEPQQVPPPVTSAPAGTDTSPTEEQAVETVKEVLGGEVISSEGEAADPPCEECGKPIDDRDIAVLSKSRFSRWLCVSDYIAETRKPRTNA